MSTLDDVFPPFALRVSAGPLHLRYARDEDVPGLCDIAANGIHDPGLMPFMVPWTDAPADDLPANTARYLWSERSTFTREGWSLVLAVRWEGELVGVQALHTTDYLTTRTAETGSWLGRRFQGRGIGTAMRQAICALAFDHLDATRLTSAAYADNPASLAVSRKVGYVANGSTWHARRGTSAENLRLVLAPESLVRGVPLAVEGVEPLRRFVGLPPVRRRGA